jgi:aspartate kinase
LKRLAVVKFGGTCLADDAGRRRAVEHCRELLGEFEKLVVVVSAMGRDGDPYATDSLPCEKDVLLSCGEVISAVVMAGELRNGGIPSRALTGWAAGIETDGNHHDSEIQKVYRDRVTGVLEECSCAVVAGFQGAGPEGNVTTIGRGGSDTTALALASALDADEVILWKTVDSIYSADPAEVPGAVEIHRISAEDLRQMAWHGAGVVHPRAAEIAIESGKRISVRSHGSGKTVTEIEPFVLSSGRYIVGVTSGPEVTQFRVEGSPGESPSGFLAGVFRLIADAGVSMDMFSVLGVSARFTVPSGSTDLVSGILREAGIAFSARGPCAKVSIVGAGMHGLQGVMARFSEALDRAGVEMLQTVDSHATISALVEADSRVRALTELHREFIEE